MNPKGHKMSSGGGSRKAERSKQSARDCRIRKKLRYQYLEELVNCREKSVFALRKELEQLKTWCLQVDSGEIPPEFVSYVTNLQKKLVDLNKLTVVPANEESSSALHTQYATPQETENDNEDLNINSLFTTEARNTEEFEQPICTSEIIISASSSTAASLQTSCSSWHVDRTLLRDWSAELTVDDLLSQIPSEDLAELPTEFCEEELEIEDSENFQ